MTSPEASNIVRSRISRPRHEENKEEVQFSIFKSPQEKEMTHQPGHVDDSKEGIGDFLNGPGKIMVKKRSRGEKKNHGNGYAQERQRGRIEEKAQSDEPATDKTDLFRAGRPTFFGNGVEFEQPNRHHDEKDREKKERRTILNEEVKKR